MRKKRDERLASEVGKRIRMLLGKRTYASLAREVGVKPHTVWNYANGVTLPSIEVLIRLSEHWGVSTDWLLKGSRSAHAVSDGEKMWLSWMRKAESFGVAEEVERYLSYLLQREKRSR